MTRRCISDDVLGSGAFCALPPRAQLLYIQMLFSADKDGVVSNERPAMALSGAGAKDLQALIDARFLLRAGRVLVFKHWWLHEKYRKDRYRPTTWQADLDTLFIREDGVYTDHPGEGYEAFLSAPNGYPAGTQRVTNGCPNLT